MPDMQVVPFKFEHVVSLGDAVGEMLVPPTEAVLLERHDSFTGLTADGQVVGCAGVVKIWPRRWMAWAHVSKPLVAEYKLQVVRAVRKFLDGLGPGRVEAAVVLGEPQNERFALACGFDRLECPFMEKYLADGRAAKLMTRVR